MKHRLLIKKHNPSAGKTFILGYTFEKQGIYTNLPVIFDDLTTET